MFWEIWPSHNPDCDRHVMPAEGLDDLGRAMEYASERLSEIWDLGGEGSSREVKIRLMEGDVTDFYIKPCPFHLREEYGPCVVSPGPVGSWEYWNTRRFSVHCPCGALGPMVAVPPSNGIYRGEYHRKKNEKARAKAVELWNRRLV